MISRIRVEEKNASIKWKIPQRQDKKIPKYVEDNHKYKDNEIKIW